MTIEYLLPSSIPADTISLEQAIRRRVRRRRRVAKGRTDLQSVNLSFLRGFCGRCDPQDAAGPKEEGEELEERAREVLRYGHVS